MSPGKIVLVLSLLAIPFPFASAKPEKVACPSVKTIQQAALSVDTARQTREGYNIYLVYKSFPNPSFYDEYDIPWFVSVNNISAQSANEAIALGKAAIQQTSYTMTDIAISSPNPKTYLCLYGPNHDIEALGLNY